MKAIQVSDYGGVDVLRLAEVDTPRPGPGEILVRVHYAGVNFIDVYTREGVYRHSHTYANKPPFTLGREAGGVVEEVGEGVTEVVPGDRVAWCLVLGSYAEYAVVPAWRVVPVPDEVDLQPATALMLQGCTAHYLSHSLFPIAPGHSALVHAAAGGVGQLLVQLAKIRGARVLATVGSPDKAAIARSRGADVVIEYDETDFRDAVLEATGGEGVHVVYDAVGRATFERSLASVRRRGTLLLFSGASCQGESVCPLDLAEAGSVFLTRPHMADYMRDSTEIRGRADDMFGHLAAGRLQVAIDRVLPLADAAAAHRILEGRGTTGKLLLATGAAG